MEANVKVMGTSDGSLVQHTAEARKGLLKAMISKFSSTPIEDSSVVDDTTLGSADTKNSANEIELRQQLDDTETTSMALTQQEREYLSSLLESGDAHSMRTASQVLQDESVFPSQPLLETTESGRVTPSPRSSKLQQHLFRIHASQPETLRRLQFVHKNSILSSPSSDSVRFPSPTTTETESPHCLIRHPPIHSSVMRDNAETATPSSLFSFTSPPQKEVQSDTGPVEQQDDDDDNNNTTTDPYEDITSWLDGSLGVEVRGDGSIVAARTTATSTAGFRILGTAADDVSCHPHVLSPPLMESLLQFIPENGLNSSCGGGSNNNNFWLKYSLVRDGPGLWSLLRQTRASTMSFLAIETDTGHVLGAFTSQPWRLSVGWYGGPETFLWKLRRSRVDNNNEKSPFTTVLEQVQAESEVQVFPYRTGHKAVQYCSKSCLMLGNAEIIPSPTFHDPELETKSSSLAGTHYGHGLYLEKDLLSGSTSTSETFGNPCLLDPNQRGQQFRVANIEVWTLTPHNTVAEAEQSELSSLFLERSDPTRLNVYSILVGGPI